MRPTSSEASAPSAEGAQAAIAGLPSEPSTPLTAKGHRTRSRLLTAARTVFERDGFLNARVADIAVVAGVSHGTFYTYFASKTEIFRSVMADVMGMVWNTRATVDGTSHLTPYERIERSNRLFLRVYRENHVMMGLMEQAVTYDEEVRQLRQMVRERSVERVRANVEQMQRDGVVRSDLDAFCVSSALVSMVSNFIYFWLVMDEGDYDDETVIHTLTELWTSALELDRNSSTSPTQMSADS